jgi:hypothetical protein
MQPPDCEECYCDSCEPPDCDCYDCDYGCGDCPFHHQAEQCEDCDCWDCDEDSCGGCPCENCPYANQQEEDEDSEEGEEQENGDEKDSGFNGYQTILRCLIGAGVLLLVGYGVYRIMKSIGNYKPGDTITDDDIRQMDPDDYTDDGTDDYAGGDETIEEPDSEHASQRSDSGHGSHERGSEGMGYGRINKCPDCWGNADPLGIWGDGKCSECHGSGKNPSILDEVTESLTGAETDCFNCGGSGQCPTCHGKGE